MSSYAENGPALIEAARADDEAAVQGCLERCPYAMHFKDDDGLTALHVAAASNSKVCVMALLDHAAAVPARSPCGDSALHVAARHGAAKAASVLIASHAFAVDAPNDWEETSLHLAASSGDLDTVKYFVGAGADKRLRDHMKRTPYVVAEDLGFGEEILSLLRVADEEPVEASLSLLRVEDDEPVTARVGASGTPAPPPPPRTAQAKPPPAGAAANVVRDRRKATERKATDVARRALDEALALS